MDYGFYGLQIHEIHNPSGSSGYWWSLKRGTTVYLINNNKNLVVQAFLPALSRSTGVHPSWGGPIAIGDDRPLNSPKARLRSIPVITNPPLIEVLLYMLCC